VQGRYALLGISYGILLVLALLIQLTALTQAMFVVMEFHPSGADRIVGTIMGFEDLGLLYFIFLLVLIAFVALIRVTKLRWRTALGGTPLLAYAIVLFVILLMPPLLFQSILVAAESWLHVDMVMPGSYLCLPAEGFYTYSLSLILLIAAQVLDRALATDTVSYSTVMGTA
jgi:hypothetical protein